MNNPYTNPYFNPNPYAKPVNIQQEVTSPEVSSGIDYSSYAQQQQQAYQNFQKENQDISESSRNLGATVKSQNPFRESAIERSRRLLNEAQAKKRAQLGDEQAVQDYMEDQQQIVKGSNPYEVHAKRNALYKLKESGSEDTRIANFEKGNLDETKLNDSELSAAIFEASTDEEAILPFKNNPKMTEYVLAQRSKYSQAFKDSMLTSSEEATIFDIGNFASANMQGLGETVDGIESLTHLNKEGEERLNALNNTVGKKIIAEGEELQDHSANLSDKRAQAQSILSEKTFGKVYSQELKKGSSKEEATRKAETAKFREDLTNTLNNSYQISKEAAQVISDIAISATGIGLAAKIPSAIISKVGKELAEEMIQKGIKEVKQETIEKALKEKLSKEGYEEALSKATESASQKAIKEASDITAKRQATATKAVGAGFEAVTEGVSAGNSAYQDASNQVLGMNLDVLKGTQEFKDLQKENPNKSDKEIQKLLADKAGSLAYSRAGVSSAILGSLGAKPESKLGGKLGNTVKGYGKDISTNTAQEIVQEGSEKIISNQAVNEATGTKQNHWYKDVGKQAAIAGFSAGSGTAVISSPTVLKATKDKAVQATENVLKNKVEKSNQKVQQKEQEELNTIFGSPESENSTTENSENKIGILGKKFSETNFGKAFNQLKTSEDEVIKNSISKSGSYTETVRNLQETGKKLLKEIESTSDDSVKESKQEQFQKVADTLESVRDSLDQDILFSNKSVKSDFQKLEKLISSENPDTEAITNLQDKINKTIAEDSTIQKLQNSSLFKMLNGIKDSTPSSKVTAEQVMGNPRFSANNIKDIRQKTEDLIKTDNSLENINTALKSYSINVSKNPSISDIDALKETKELLTGLSKSFKPNSNQTKASEILIKQLNSYLNNNNNKGAVKAFRQLFFGGMESSGKYRFGLLDVLSDMEDGELSANSFTKLNQLMSHQLGKQAALRKAYKEFNETGKHEPIVNLMDISGSSKPILNLNKEALSFGSLNELKKYGSIVSEDVKAIKDFYDTVTGNKEVSDTSNKESKETKVEEPVIESSNKPTEDKTNTVEEIQVNDSKPEESEPEVNNNEVTESSSEVNNDNEIKPDVSTNTKKAILKSIKDFEPKWNKNKPSKYKDIVDTEDNKVTYSDEDGTHTIPYSMVVALRDLGYDLNKNLFNAVTSKEREPYNISLISETEYDSENDSMFAESLDKLKSKVDSFYKKNSIAVFNPDSKKSAFTTINTVLNFTDEEGKINEDLKASIALTIGKVVGNAKNFSFRKEDQYNEFFDSNGGVKSIRKRTNAEIYGDSYASIKNPVQLFEPVDSEGSVSFLGEDKYQFINTLGREVIANLGVSFNRKSEDYAPNVEASMITALGQQAYLNLLELGMLNVYEVETGNGNKIHYVNLKTNDNSLSNAQLNVYEVLSSGKDIPELSYTQAENKAKDSNLLLQSNLVRSINSGLAKSIYEKESSKSAHIGSLKDRKGTNVGSGDRKVKSSQTNTPFGNRNSDTLDKAINVHQRTSFAVNTPMFNLYKANRESFMYMVGYVPNVDKLAVSDITKKSIQSKNTQILRAVDLFEKYLEQAELEGISPEDLMLQFDYKVQTNNRIMLQSDINPQSDKVIRELLRLVQSNITQDGTIVGELNLDITLGKAFDSRSNKAKRSIERLIQQATGTKQGKNKDFSIGFLLALGQAFGVKIEKEHSGSIFSKVSKILSEDSMLMRMADLTWKMNQAVESNEEYVPNESETKLMQEFAKEFGNGSPRALSAVQALSDYLYRGTDSDKFKNQKDRKKWSTTLLLEADGISNGMHNIIRQFTLNFTTEYLDSLKRTGVIPLDVLVQAYQNGINANELEGSASMFTGIQKDDSKLNDSYEIIAERLTNVASDALIKLNQMLSDKLDFSKYGSIIDLIYDNYEDSSFDEISPQLNYLLQLNTTGALDVNGKNLLEDFFGQAYKKLPNNIQLQVKRNLAKAGVTPTVYGGQLTGITNQLVGDIIDNITKLHDKLIADVSKGLNQKEKDKKYKQLVSTLRALGVPVTIGRSTKDSFNFEKASKTHTYSNYEQEISSGNTLLPYEQWVLFQSNKDYLLNNVLTRKLPSGKIEPLFVTHGSRDSYLDVSSLSLEESKSTALGKGIYVAYPINSKGINRTDNFALSNSVYGFFLPKDFNYVKATKKDNNYYITVDNVEYDTSKIDTLWLKERGIQGISASWLADNSQINILDSSILVSADISTVGINNSDNVEINDINHQLKVVHQSKDLIIENLKQGLASDLHKAVQDSFEDSFALLGYAIAPDQMSFIQFIKEFTEKMVYAKEDRNKKKKYVANDPRRNDDLSRNEVKDVLKTISSTPVIATAFHQDSSLFEDIFEKGNALIKTASVGEIGQVTITSPVAVTSGKWNSHLSTQLFSTYKKYLAAGASSAIGSLPSTESATQVGLAEELASSLSGITHLNVFDGVDALLYFRNLIGQIANKVTNNVHLDTNLLKAFYDRFTRSGFDKYISDLKGALPFKGNFSKYSELINSQLVKDRNGSIKLKIDSVNQLQYHLANFTFARMRLESLKLNKDIYSNKHERNLIQQRISNLNSLILSFGSTIDDLLQNKEVSLYVNENLLDFLQNDFDTYGKTNIKDLVLEYDGIVDDFATKASQSEALKYVEKKYLPSIINQFGGANRGYYFNEDKFNDIGKQFLEFLTNKGVDIHNVDFRLDSTYLSEFLTTNEEISKDYNAKLKETYKKLHKPFINLDFARSEEPSKLTIKNGKESDIKDLLDNSSYKGNLLKLYLNAVNRVFKDKFIISSDINEIADHFGLQGQEKEAFIENHEGNKKGFSGYNSNNLVQEGYSFKEFPFIYIDPNITKHHDTLLTVLVHELGHMLGDSLYSFMVNKSDYSEYESVMDKNTFNELSAIGSKVNSIINTLTRNHGNTKNVNDLLKQFLDNPSKFYHYSYGREGYTHLSNLDISVANWKFISNFSDDNLPNGWTVSDYRAAKQSVIHEFISYAIDSDAVLNELAIRKTSKGIIDSVKKFLSDIRNQVLKLLGLGKLDNSQLSNLYEAIQGMAIVFERNEDLRQELLMTSIEHHQNSQRTDSRIFGSINPTVLPNTSNNDWNNKLNKFISTFQDNVGNISDVLSYPEEAKLVKQSLTDTKSDEIIKLLRNLNVGFSPLEEEAFKLSLAANLANFGTANTELHQISAKAIQEIIQNTDLDSVDPKVFNIVFNSGKDSVAIGTALLTTNKQLSSLITANNPKTKVAKQLKKLNDNLDNLTIFKDNGSVFKTEDKLNQVQIASMLFNFRSKPSLKAKQEIAQKELSKLEILTELQEKHKDVYDNLPVGVKQLFGLTNDLLTGQDLLSDGSGADSSIGSLVRKLLENRNKIKGRDTLLSQFAKWVIGQDFNRQYSAKFKGEVDQTSQAIRERISSVIPLSLRNQFENLTKQDEQALDNVLNSSELHHIAFLNITGIKPSDILRNAQYRSQAVLDVTQNIKEILAKDYESNQVNQITNYLIWQSKGLGHRMVTGEVRTKTVKESGNILPNAKVISSLKHIGKIANKTTEQDNVDNFESLVTQLASLYSLEYQNQDDLNTIADLFENESRGMDAVMKSLVQLDTELNIQRQGNYFGKDGFIYNKQNPYQDVKLVLPSNQEQQVNLSKLGYKHKADLPTGEQVWVTNDSTVNRFTTGIFGLADTSIKGINQTTGKPVKGVFGETTYSNSTINFDNHPALTNAKYYDNLLSKNSIVTQIDASGDIVGTYVELPKHLEKQFIETYENGLDAIGNIKGRIMEEIVTEQNNQFYINKLNQVYNQRTDKSVFTKIDGNLKPKSHSSKDLEFANRLNNIYNSLPSATKEMITRQGGLYIETQELNNILGYSQPSMTDLWTGKSGLPTGLQRTLKSTFDITGSLMGLSGVQVAKRFERGLSEVVSLGKDFVLNRSVIVPVFNLMSNIIHLWNRGISYNKITPLVKEGTQHILKYNKDMNRLTELYHLKDISSGKEKSRYDSEINLLKQAINKNPVKTLVDEGILTSITLDNKSNSDKEFDYITQIQNKVGVNKFKESKIGKVWGNIAIQEGSDTHSALEQVLDLGDFVAKYAMYQHLTRDRGFNSERAMNVIRDEFVNYSYNRGRVFDFMNQTGLTWFLSYKLGIQKIILRSLRRNFFRTSAVYAGAKATGIDSVPTQNLLFDGSLRYQTDASNIYGAFGTHWFSLLF